MPKALSETEKAERVADKAFRRLLKARGVGAREKAMNDLLAAVRDYQAAEDAEADGAE